MKSSKQVWLVCVGSNNKVINKLVFRNINELKSQVDLIRKWVNLLREQGRKSRYGLALVSRSSELRFDVGELVGLRFGVCKASKNLGQSEYVGKEMGWLNM